MDLKELCRLCLAKYGNQITYPIFSEDTILKLNVCAGLNVNKNINLPEQICEQCYQNLENAHQFRITCQNSQKRLNDLIGAANPNNFSPIHTESPRPSEKTIQKCDVHSEHNIKFPNKLLSKTQKSILSCKIKPKKHQLSDLESDSNIVKTEISQNDIKIKRKYTREKFKVNSENKDTNNKLICPICQIVYKTKCAYNYHMRRHRNEMDFICEICGSAFETNFKLSRHLLQHMGIKKFPCRTCDISFPTSSNRDRHERRLHTTIRPFQCEYCNKAFAYSDQLKDHIRVHTGEKPFVCENCDTRFKRKSLLLRHKKAFAACFFKSKEN